MKQKVCIDSGAGSHGRSKPRSCPRSKWILQDWLQVFFASAGNGVAGTAKVLKLRSMLLLLLLVVSGFIGLGPVDFDKTMAAL